MFCPNCKCEYVKGIKICPDCNIALVDKLSSEASKKDEKTYELVKIFTSTNPGTLALAKSILDGEGIKYYVNNEFMQTVYGVGSGFPAEIIVRDCDSKNASELLSDLK